VTKQQTLFDAVDEPEPGECAHGDTRRLPVPNEMHLADVHEWRDRRPVWCSDCHRVVERVES